MQLIADLSDMIEEELNDAEKYIKCAMKHKDSNPGLAQTFAKISGEEMNHVALLHEQVVALIAEYRKANGAPPEKMQWVYDYLHNKHMEKATAVKTMQMIFKG